MRSILSLHRTGTKADWDGVKPADRNYWQRWAARTNGIVTPGNVISVSGALLVLLGLYLLRLDNIFISIALITAGRLADVLDGYVAELTGTKSSLGEAVDVSIDKIVGFIALLVLLLTYLLPVLFIAIVGTQNVINSLIGVAGRYRQVHLHPSREGKLSVAVTWGSLVSYLSYQAVEAGNYYLSRVFLFLSLILFGMFLYYGTLSTYTYLMQLKLTVPRRSDEPR
jgi:phosphatidylglycerophosphate synthase